MSDKTLLIIGGIGILAYIYSQSDSKPVEKIIKSNNIENTITPTQMIIKETTQVPTTQEITQMPTIIETIQSPTIQENTQIPTETEFYGNSRRRRMNMNFYNKTDEPIEETIMPTTSTIKIIKSDKPTEVPKYILKTNTERSNKFIKFKGANAFQDRRYRDKDLNDFNKHSLPNFSDDDNVNAKTIRNEL